MQKVSRRVRKWLTKRIDSVLFANEISIPLRAFKNLVSLGARFTPAYSLTTAN